MLTDARSHYRIIREVGRSVGAPSRDRITRVYDYSKNLFRWKAINFIRIPFARRCLNVAPLGVQACVCACARFMQIAIGYLGTRRKNERGKRDRRTILIYRGGERVRTVSGLSISIFRSCCYDNIIDRRIVMETDEQVFTERYNRLRLAIIYTNRYDSDVKTLGNLWFFIFNISWCFYSTCGGMLFKITKSLTHTRTVILMNIMSYVIDLMRDLLTALKVKWN